MWRGRSIGRSKQAQKPKKMTPEAELLGSEHNMSESTRHELLKNGSSSDLVNIHYLHSVGGP